MRNEESEVPERGTIDFSYLNSKIYLFKGVPAIVVVPWLFSIIFGFSFVSLVFATVFTIITVLFENKNMPITEFPEIIKFMQREKKIKLFPME
ncbi:MAG: hypothetical protein HOG49_05010 [Candidatus Scalindua sp.]|jgi:hypothetical protein|nr:hypothetical protein [Candidatus Scalindua sp.]